jgi:putative flippase GtrA
MVEAVASRRAVLAAILATIVAAALDVPLLGNFVMTQPHPANWLPVIVSNALLLLVAWLITFIVVRFVIRGWNGE